MVVKLKNKTNLLSFVDSHIIDYPTKTNLNVISIRSFGVVSSKIYGPLKFKPLAIYKKRYQSVMDELKKIPSLDLEQVESNFKKIHNEVFANMKKPIEKGEYSKTVDLIPEKSMEIGNKADVTEFGSHLDSFTKKFVHSSDTYMRYYNGFETTEVANPQVAASKHTADLTYNSIFFDTTNYNNILSDTAQCIVKEKNEQFLEVLPEFMELTPNITFIGTEVFLTLFLVASVYVAYMYNLANPTNYNYFVMDLKKKNCRNKNKGYGCCCCDYKAS